MKTKYKYVCFRKSAIIVVSNSDISMSKQVWTCYANKSSDTLGTVLWYPSWKQYCVQFNDDAIFSTDCLTDIADFLEQLNAKDK